MKKTTFILILALSLGAMTACGGGGGGSSSSGSTVTGVETPAKVSIVTAK